MEVLALASRRMHTAFLQPNYFGRIAAIGSSYRPANPAMQVRHFPSHANLPNGRYRIASKLSASTNDQDKPKKKSRVQMRKQKANKGSKPKELFRAERVLANRSGKTRAECHKLLTKYAVSILEEGGDDDPTGAVDLSRLRIVSAKEQIPMTAKLYINKKFEVPNVPPLLMVYHKPKWVLSTMKADGRQRRNLENLRFAWSNRMHPVGRLDYDTSGLLLFSSSGKLTQKLLHPKFEKQKEYVATVTGTVIEEELRERLESGIELADIQTRRRSSKNQQTDSSSGEAADSQTFMTRAELINVRHWPEEEVAPHLQSIRTNLPSEYNVTDLNLRGYMDQLDANHLSDIRLVVQEGKHRMVRRMLASCGHPVVSLKRERIGIIELGDLREGAFRNITAEEASWAQTIIESKG